MGAGPGPPGFPPEQERGNFAAFYLTLGHFLGRGRGIGGHTAVGTPSPSPQGVAFLGKVSPGDASQTASSSSHMKKRIQCSKIWLDKKFKLEKKDLKKSGWDDGCLWDE